MMRLNRLFALLVLAIGGVGASFANDYNLPVYATTYQAFGYAPHNNSSISADGSFSDTFTITTASPERLQIVGYNGVSGLTAQWSGGGSSFSSGLPDVFAPAAWLGNSVAVLNGQVAQANTTYTLTVSGKVTNWYGTGTNPNWIGDYQLGFGGASVAAVPEPETYVMLLAGLGLLGFTVKRRRQTFSMV
jgi:hypothetical protein